MRIPDFQEWKQCFTEAERYQLFKNAVEAIRDIGNLMARLQDRQESIEYNADQDMLRLETEVDYDN